MEDPSVDITHLSRKQILVELGLKSDQGFFKLQAQLRKKLEHDHPIKDFIKNLDKQVLIQIYNQISINGSAVKRKRREKFIIEHFFENFAKAPLASLKFFIENRKFPDELKMNFLFQENLKFTKTNTENKENVTETDTQPPEILKLI